MTDFSIAPKFALYRAYIKGVGFYAPPSSTKVTHSDGYEVIWPPAYNVAVRAVIKPEFLNWNSNCYTPDFIYSAYYAYNVSNPSVHFTYLPFTTFVHIDSANGNWFLCEHLDFFADFYAFSLPPSPSGWWKPLP